MAKPVTRPYSRYTKTGLTLLAQVIRMERLERKLTLAELAERAAVSRGLLQRIEQGDPGCAIGAVFEVASILGIELFNADEETLNARTAAQERMLMLQPRSARASRKPVKDDF